MDRNWQIITCPHCGKVNAIEMNTVRFRWIDVHPHRKSFETLKARQCERDYVCEVCHRAFYITLQRLQEAFMAFQHPEVLIRA